MTTESQLSDRLTQLGAALDRAIRADLANHPRALPRLRRSRRALAGAAVAAVLVPAAAIAATQLITTNQVAASLPQGTEALIGTDPTCTVVQASVEYHCVLAKPPSNGGPVQAAVEQEPDGTIKLEVVKDGQATTSLIHTDSLEDYQHMVVQAKALASSTGGSVTTVTAPSGAIPTAGTDWTGTVEDTVDASKHVNGGCRALDATGTEWQCYIGEAAVRQGIIGQGLLGQSAPSPGVG